MKNLKSYIIEAQSEGTRVKAKGYTINNFMIDKTQYGTWKVSGTIKGCKVSQVVREEPTKELAIDALIACYDYPNK